MSLGVRIYKKDPNIPDSVVHNIIKYALEITEEEAQKYKTEQGYFYFKVNDPIAIHKLSEFADKYSNLITIEFSEDTPKNPYTLAMVAVRSNWGLAVVWSAIYLVLLLLSLLPVLGIFFGIVLQIFIFSFSVMVAKSLLEVDLEEKAIERVFSKMTIGSVKNFMGAGAGLWLGGLLVGLLIGIFFFFISSLAEEDPRDFTTLLLVVLIILLLVMWLFYAYPLILARVIKVENPTFETGLMAFLSLLTPSFIKESFSNEYLGLGGVYLFVASAALIAMIVAFMFIITIPVTLLILYWLSIYAAFVAVFYVKNKN